MVLIAVALPAAVPRETHRNKPTPRIFGDKVPINLINTNNKRVQQKIVNVHNYFRSRVKPPAANMLMMSWHPGLAKSAQRWANQCPGLVHDNATNRYLNDLGNTGQNLFMTTRRTYWQFAVRAWFMEYKDFEYGTTPTDFHKVGHYTQVVWATTHLVGCGVNHCTNSNGPLGKDYFIYVCNYAPSGNYVNGLSRPYVAGEPCSKCKNHCSRNKLCTNACYFSDLWSNCPDLKKSFPTWVCDTRTKEGLRRRKSCGATCNCEDKIYYRHG